jgi:hypothetical protein
MRTLYARLFARLAATTGGILLAVAGVVACSGNVAPTAISACDVSDVVYTNGLVEKLQVDYVEYREESSYPSSNPLELKTTKLHSSGHLCATSNYPERCKAKVAQLKVLSTDPIACKDTDERGRYTGCVVTYLVFTRGDEVGTVAVDSSFVDGHLTTLGEVLIAARAARTIYNCQYGVPPTYEALGGGNYRVVGRTIKQKCGEYLPSLVETASAASGGVTTSVLVKPPPEQQCFED